MTDVRHGHIHECYLLFGIFVHAIWYPLDTLQYSIICTALNAIVCVALCLFSTSILIYLCLRLLAKEINIFFLYDCKAADIALATCSQFNMFFCSVVS